MKKNVNHKRRYLSPKYWLTWILLGGLRLLILLPYKYQITLGSYFGKGILYAIPSRHKIVKRNIELCFPEKSATEQKQLLKACARNMGIALFETALAWWGNQEQLKKTCSTEGLEHLKKAQEQGHSILLLTAHMTSTEIGARLLALHMPVQVMYKPAKDPVYEYIMLKARNRYFHNTVHRKDMRSLLRGLKNKIPTWYAPDQNFGHNDTVFAPFFNIPATTLTATARIAKTSNAIIIPYFPYRLPNNEGYKLVFHEPIKNFPCGDDIEDATHINKIIEDAIRVSPAEYFWAHKRFRTRPEGEQAIY